MMNLTLNRTARLTLIAVVAAMLVAIAIPLAASAQSGSRPVISEIRLVKDGTNDGFAPGQTVTANVYFDRDVRYTAPWDAVAGGVPMNTLTLDIGNLDRRAEYVGVVDGDRSVRRFRYTVQAKDKFWVITKSNGESEIKVHAESLNALPGHWVPASGDADGCEGGELTDAGAMLLILMPFLTFYDPGNILDDYYTPYTCYRHSSRLLIPNPGNQLQYTTN